MNRRASLEILTEAVVGGGIIEHFRDTLNIPNSREVLIQCDKLKRMIGKHLKPNPHEGPARLLSGASAKKHDKQHEQEARAIGQQRKKVRKLQDSFFKATFRRGGNKFRNAHYQIWRRAFDRGVQSTAEFMMKSKEEQLQMLEKKRPSLNQERP